MSGPTGPGGGDGWTGGEGHVGGGSGDGPARRRPRAVPVEGRRPRLRVVPPEGPRHPRPAATEEPRRPRAVPVEGRPHPRVVPTRRHGRERLYVLADDGATLAWYDPDAARVDLLAYDHGDDVLDALAPFLTGRVAVGPPPVPTPAELARLSLPPDDDLAPNRPGEALLVALERDPGPRHRLRTDPRRHALEAERTVGTALDRMDGAGWYALHSVPLPGGDRIHHLLIGPGGVFALHTLHTRKRRITVDDPLVALGRRDDHSVLRGLRADAARASYALTAEVHPVLVLVAPAALRITAVPRAVRVLTDTDVPDLSRLGGVLKPADVDGLHAMARDRRTWAGA